MNLFTFFLISLTVYSGLFFGSLLSYVVKEELQPGEQYFKLGKRFVYFVFAITTVLVAGFRPWGVAGALFVVLAFAYIKYIDSRYLQLFLGLILYYFVDHPLLPLFASMIFIFNFPTATLMIHKSIKEHLTDKKKVVLSILVSHLWFFVGVVFYAVRILQ